MVLLPLWFAAGLTACGAEAERPPVTIRVAEPILIVTPPEILSCPRPYPPPVVDLQSELVTEVLDPAWVGWNACHEAIERAAAWQKDEISRRGRPQPIPPAAAAATRPEGR